MSTKPYSITPVTWSDKLPATGPRILTYTITYPHISSAKPSAAVERINEYYINMAQSFYNQLNKIVQDYSNEDSLPPPTFPYEAILDYRLSFLDDNTASIYTDQYQYLGGAHGNTIRSSETWNLKNGERIPLTKYYPDTNVVIDKILKQIQQQIEAGNNIYFEDYKELVAQHFRPENYYLTPDGVVVYFQQYDIGPYVSGIIEFHL